MKKERARKEQAGNRKRNPEEIRNDYRRKTNRSFIFYLGIGLLIIIVASLAKHYLTPAPFDIPDEIIRKPYVSGQFYPANADNLGILIDSYLGGSKDLQLGDVRAIIVPHAGYIYSGQVAAHGFKQLSGKADSIKKVFIIASNHVRGAVYRGISLPNYTHYETPLGKVKVSPVVAKLAENDLFTHNDAAHTSHIIEVELPFLQKILGDDFEIIPMVVGGLTEEDISTAAELISEKLDENSIIIISSDLSHYHPYDVATQLDVSCIQQIESQSYEGASSCEACGLDAILILLRISEIEGWDAKVIDYKNSGDTAGPKDAVVGYSSVIFYRKNKEDGSTSDIPKVFDDAQQEFLLGLARTTVENYVRTGTVPSADQSLPSADLEEVRGCFVTLNKDGDLRGCIGHILPRKPLYECIIENSINAASADPRVDPVTADELEDIHIDISVLTLPHELTYSSPEDLLRQLRPGIDGVVLQSGFRSSTYLPQVWDQLPDKTVFLESLCKKQGSPPDCWKSAKVSVYQAQVFEE